MLSKCPRRIWLFLKVAGIALVAAIMAGIIYEQVGRWQDCKRLPQVGRSIDIGMRTLNIYCSGEGGPPVILDAPGYSPCYI